MKDKIEILKQKILVAQNPSMSYVTLNLPDEIFIPPQIADRSVALAGDIAVTLQQLRL